MNMPPFRHDLDKYPNLISLATFSKAWGAAGIRLGMAFASQDIIALFNKVKYPYNVNVLTQKKAQEILSDLTLLQRRISMIVEERAKIIRAFKIFRNDQTFLDQSASGIGSARRYTLPMPTSSLPA